jgi:hypothetical protein
LTRRFYILILWVAILLFSGLSSFSQNLKRIHFDFYGDAIELPFDSASFVEYTNPITEASVEDFYEKMNKSHFEPVVSRLLYYKNLYRLDDWLYYQLIRKAAQSISAKADNYPRYTLYKWYFLCKSGYDAVITISENRMLFYVQSDERIYNIPYRIKNDKQYVCLNYHDYGYIDFTQTTFSEVVIPVPGAKKSFSYKVTQLPDFKTGNYQEKDIQFNYNENEYHFRVKFNPEVKNIFANYPVVDYESYFNIPLSAATYGSLIPSLKKNIKGLHVKDGVDYLMHFTRYAFLFKPDLENFGQEKRLSPEQTLIYENSDCEDRAGLFFYLVKEIYNLPMIVLEYPKHVTIAVKFDKPYGTTITYNGVQYSICDPTPQKEDLRIGQSIPSLRHSTYTIPYIYNPFTK